MGPTTDELRSLLAERAELPDSVGPAARVEAVAGRVRGVRRRRRRLVAVAAVAAVVAAGASVVPALRRPAPGPVDAPSTLAGRTVPRTETAAGYTYHYVSGVQSKAGAKQLSLRLAAAPRPRLVMWVSSSTVHHPVLALRSSIGPQTYRSAAQGFWSYALVPPRQSPRLVLSQRDAPARNRLALAVFALDRKPPAGISNGVVTFRKSILDDRLVAGLIGKPGQTDLRTTIEPQHGAVRISDLCYGGGSQDRVHVSFNGDELLDSTCSRTPEFDPGAAGGASFTAAQNPLPTDTPVRVHVWLTGTDGAAPTSAAGAVIGFGLYDVRTDTFRLAGMRIPALQEYDGHQYAEAGNTASASGGAREVTTQVQPSEVPLLVTTASSGNPHGSARAELLVNGRVDTAFEDDTGSGSWSSGYVIQPGETPTLTFRLVGGDPRDVRLGIALSEQVH